MNKKHKNSTHRDATNRLKQFLNTSTSNLKAIYLRRNNSSPQRAKSHKNKFVSASQQRDKAIRRMLDKEISKLKQQTNSKLKMVQCQRRKNKSKRKFSVTLHGKKFTKKSHRKSVLAQVESIKKTSNGITTSLSPSTVFDKLDRVIPQLNRGLVIDVSLLKKTNRVALLKQREIEAEIKETKSNIKKFIAAKNNSSNVFSNQRGHLALELNTEQKNILTSEIYDGIQNHSTNLKGRRAYLKLKAKKQENISQSVGKNTQNEQYFLQGNLNKPEKSRIFGNQQFGLQDSSSPLGRLQNNSFMRRQAEKGSKYKQNKKYRYLEQSMIDCNIEITPDTNSQSEQLNQNLANIRQLMIGSSVKNYPIQYSDKYLSRQRFTKSFKKFQFKGKTPNQENSKKMNKNTYLGKRQLLNFKFWKQMGSPKVEQQLQESRKGRALLSRRKSLPKQWQKHAQQDVKSSRVMRVSHNQNFNGWKSTRVKEASRKSIGVILNLEGSQSKQEQVERPENDLRSSSLPFISPEYSLKVKFDNESSRSRKKKIPLKTKKQTKFHPASFAKLLKSKSISITSRKRFKFKRKQSRQPKEPQKESELSAWNKNTNSLIPGSLRIDFEVENDEDITKFF